MTNLFKYLTFILFGGWLIGFLFLEIGLEIHIMLLLAGMSYTLKLIREELSGMKKGGNPTDF